MLKASLSALLHALTPRCYRKVVETWRQQRGNRTGVQVSRSQERTRHEDGWAEGSGQTARTRWTDKSPPTRNKQPTAAVFRCQKRDKNFRIVTVISNL
jgi:hypothetical protein